jgi:hypothetical protein
MNDVQRGFPLRPRRGIALTGRAAIALIAALVVALTPHSGHARSETDPIGYAPAPNLHAEPPFTRGDTNILMWDPIDWSKFSTGADNKPTFRRHFVITITDTLSGAMREFDVPGGGNITGFTVKRAQFPTANVDGRQFGYRLRYRWRVCDNATGSYCNHNKDLDSSRSVVAVSTQDATPPVASALTLANGDVYTASLSVAAHFEAADVGAHPSGLAAMQLTADSSFPCAKLGLCVVPFTHDTFVRLAGGPDGIRTIYARAFDAAASGGAGGRITGPSFGVPSGNASQAVSDTVVLDTVGPKVVVNRTPEPQKAGKAVTFDASSSTDAGGFSADSGVDSGTAIWDFGDGAKASGLVVSHKYATAGRYTSSFTLRDKVGNGSTLQVPVTVMPSDWGGTGTPTQTAGTPTANPSQADTTAPVLAGVKVARAGTRLRVSFNLSEDASVLIGVERIRPRRIVAGTTRRLKPGARVVTLRARLERRTRYRVLVAGRDAAGNTGPTRVLIVRGPRR